MSVEVEFSDEDGRVAQLILFLHQRMQFTEHADDLVRCFDFGGFAGVQVRVGVVAV
jgi:hypothetical protein